MTLKTGVMMLKIQLCHHRNKLHLKYIYLMENSSFILNCNNISQYCYFYHMFDQTNAALVSIIDFFQKYLNILFNPMLPGIDDISQTEK